jgi:hypothetical protein
MILRFKIISEKDLEIRFEHYKQFENRLLKMVNKSFGYHNKFDTGYGWRLNASKLRDYSIITHDFYNKLFDWFDTEFKLEQKVLVEDWKDYCTKDIEISNALNFYY